jgi:hypothetical protein
MDEGDALRCFPDAQCAESWPEAINGDYDPHCCRFPKSCSVRGQSVKWIVVAEPLVCLACGGHDYDCYECDENGLPDVQIVSYTVFLAEDGENAIRMNEHGVVPIGAPLPVVFNWNDWMEKPVVSVEQTGDVVLVRNRIDGFCEEVTDITDQFGDQAVTPGMWAHPIEVVS